MTDRPLALYVHIPFCERKCHYCDFNSGVQAPAVRDRYVAALLREISGTSLAGRSAGSVFFGGGTPSVLPASQIAGILDALRDQFRFGPDIEITVECNPGTVASERMAGESTDSFLGGLLDAGVNRLSFGVQSFDPALLTTLGRIHSPAQAESSVRSAQAAGFDNINVDLMFALPGQTMPAWQETLRRALDLGVSHLSAYSLIVEPDTPFHLWDAEGRLPRPGEDEEAAMYQAVIDRLAAAGYERYEVSAFARPGRRCRHNLTYWRNEEYVGFGVGAASYIAGERSTREPRLENYIVTAEHGEDTTAEAERLDLDGQMAETMMMGLRLADGVGRRAFRERFGVDPAVQYSAVIDQFAAMGLLQRTPEAVALTARGFFLANEVWEAFVG
ncbi:MAG TPA: radical SAM family heme chaperone HemW [Armatimonadota bacterium]